MGYTCHTGANESIQVIKRLYSMLGQCSQCCFNTFHIIFYNCIFNTPPSSKQPLHPDFKTVNLLIAAATSTPFQILNLSQLVIIVASIKVQDTCNVVGHIYRLCFTCIILVKRQAFHDKFDSRLLSCGRGEREIGDRHSCLCLTSSI